MDNSAAYINIQLFDESLSALSKISTLALERGSYFLPLYKKIRQMRPFIENFALYCNERLGAQIILLENTEKDIFKAASKDNNLIHAIHQFIQTQDFAPTAEINLYTEKGLMELGSLLRRIDHLSPEEQAIQKYFMRGMINSTTAIISYQKQYKKDDIFEQIDDSDIPEQLIETLSSQGLNLTDENEEAIYEILYQECDDTLSNKHKTSSQALTTSLADSLKEEFKLETKNLPSLLEKTSESLYKFIKQTKKKMQKYTTANRNLMLLAQELPAPNHNSIETAIYGISTQTAHQKKAVSKIQKKALPPYLQPFAQTAEFQTLQQQASFWEKYEHPLPAKKFSDTKTLLSVMSLASVKYLYQDFPYYDDILDALMDKYDDDDEDEDKKNLSLMDNSSSEQEHELLDFAQKLLETLEMSHKYADLDLNDSGVTVDTIKSMQQKETLDSQDITILSELLGTLENNIEDAAEVINIAIMPDYQKSAKLIQKLPHGVVKKDALACFSTALECTFADLYEEMEGILCDIDHTIGHPVENIDETITDFLITGISQHNDLKPYEPEDLTQKLHQGILSEYILPHLQKIKPDGTEKKASTAYIEEYDTFSLQTQLYLQNLAEYYAHKTLAFIPQPEKISTEVWEEIKDYNACLTCLNDMDKIQIEVETTLREEEKIFQKYQRYKEQKSHYELPPNIDLWLTAQMKRSKTLS